MTVIVLFCAGGTGIYGTLDAGMTGNNTILISKSILDFFTAAIFACHLCLQSWLRRFNHCDSAIHYLLHHFLTCQTHFPTNESNNACRFQSLRRPLGARHWL